MMQGVYCLLVVDRRILITASIQKVKSSGPCRYPCFTPIMEGIHHLRDTVNLLFHVDILVKNPK